MSVEPSQKIENIKQKSIFSCKETGKKYEFIGYEMLSPRPANQIITWLGFRPLQPYEGEEFNELILVED